MSGFLPSSLLPVNPILHALKQTWHLMNTGMAQDNDRANSTSMLRALGYQHGVANDAGRAYGYASDPGMSNWTQNPQVQALALMNFLQRAGLMSNQVQS